VILPSSNRSLPDATTPPNHHLYRGWNAEMNNDDDDDDVNVVVAVKASWNTTFHETITMKL
jgi:hypothetical protein